MSDSLELARELAAPKRIGSAEDFFHLPTVETAEVEAGGLIWKVRGLSAGERDVYESAMLHGSGKDQKVDLTNARARLVVMATIDDTGQRIFKDTDIARVARKPATVIEPLFERIRELSGMTEEEIAKLTGNLNGLSADSSSFSPE